MDGKSEVAAEKRGEGVSISSPIASEHTATDTTRADLQREPSPSPIPPTAEQPAAAVSVIDEVAAAVASPLSPFGNNAIDVPHETIRELLASCENIASASSPQWFAGGGSIAPRNAHDSMLLDRTSTDAIRFGLTASNIFVVNWGGIVTEIDAMYIFLRCLLAGLVILVSFLALGPAMQPGGVVFSPLVTILFASLVGSFICKLTQWPAIIGTFIGGLIWVALPQTVAGKCPPLFYSIVRTVAVAVILSRSGINFRWAVIKPVFINVLGLALLPNIMELSVHAFAARFLFPSTWTAAIIQGAVAAPVANSVMIPCISVVRAMGYTVSRGPSVLMMVAGAADNVFGVLLINFILGVMYPADPNDSIYFRLLLAPAQVAGGAFAGILIGNFVVAYINAYARRVQEYDEGDAKRQAERAVTRDTCALVLITACVSVFGANYFYLPGFGSVAAAASCATISHLWTQQKQDSRKNDLNSGMAAFWDVAVAPCLFALVGASVNLTSLVDADFLWRACLCILAGIAAKWATVYLVCTGTDFLRGERIFFAIGFSSKATIQAALGGRFAALAQTDAISAGSEEGSVAVQLAASAIVELVSVLCIILGAIGSGIAMKVTGPLLLTKDSDFAKTFTPNPLQGRGTGKKEKE